MEILLSAEKKWGLYIIKEKTVTAYITKIECVELLHDRFGNTHYNAIKDVDKDKGISIANNCTFLCLHPEKNEAVRFPNSDGLKIT